MDYKIGKFDPKTGTVPVTFTAGDIVHQRAVNACLTAAGKHDRQATLARIADVARGVAVKIAAGAITMPVAPPAPETLSKD